MPPASASQLIDPLRLLRRDWRLLVVLTVLGGALGAWYYSSTSKTYRAETAIRFARISEITGQTIFNPLETLLPDPGSNTQVREIRSDAVLGRAVAQLPGVSVDDLRDRLKVGVDVSTNNVQLDVEAESAQQALRDVRAVTDAVVAETTRQVRTAYENAIDRIEATGRSGVQRDSRVVGAQVVRLRFLAATTRPATIVDAGFLPTEAVTPSAVFPAGLGAVFGLLVALGIASLREARDRNLRTPDDLTDITTLPHAGTLPATAVDGPLSLETRGVVDQVARGLGRAHSGVVVVTDATAGDDAALVAHALGTAYALRGFEAVLVDGDLRTSALSRRLGLANGPGLLEALRTPARATELVSGQTLAATDIGPANARVLGSGELGAPLERLLASGAPAEVLRRLRGDEGNPDVIVSAGPLLATADPLEWAALADQIVLAVPADGVTPERLHACERALGFAGDRVSLVVVD